jgi:hypothetical protein
MADEIQSRGIEVDCEISIGLLFISDIGVDPDISKTAVWISPFAGRTALEISLPCAKFDGFVRSPLVLSLGASEEF